MSIRLKLTIMFLAVATIPLLLVGVLTFHNYRDALEANHLSQLQNVAAHKADKIEAYFTAVKSNIEIAQGLYNIKKNLPVLLRFSGDPNNPEFQVSKKQLGEQLHQMQSVLPDVSDIMLVDLEGKVVYTNKSGHYSKNLSNSPSDAERTAFAEGKERVYFSDIYPDKAEDNRFEMLVTAPAFDFNNVPIGVIALEADMAPVYKLVQDTTGLGNTGETLIGKRIGNEAVFLNPLRHDPNAALARRTKLGDQTGFAIQRAVQNKEGAGQYIDYRGKKVIGAWRYIPSLDWGMVAKIDSKEAFADVTNLRNLVAIILGIVIVLSSITAFSIAQSIAEPIKKLSDGAAIVGSGNLDHRIGTNLKDEIGQLSRTFDKMTSDLKQTLASREELSIEVRERKRAEEKLQRLAQQRQLALDAAEMGWWHYDPITRIASWDDRYKEIFGVTGYTRPNDEILAQIVHPDDRPGVWAKVEAALDPINPQPYSAQYRINRPDGSMRWIEAHGAASFEGLDDDRRATSFVGTVTDITERKKTEQVLRESREDLDRAQAVGSIGSWRLDTRRNVLTWSDENHRIFGIPKGTPMTYETFLSTVHPDDRQYVDAKWKAGLAGEDYDIEHRIVVGAQTKWVREKAYLEFDNGGVLLGGFGITQDITERKHAAEQLEMVARFPSENPSPVLRIASDGTILYSNGPGLSLLEEWGRGVGQEAPEDWCEQVARALDSGQNIVQEVTCGKRIVSVVAAPVVEGRYVNLYGRDVTKERKAEQALQKARDELEKKVEERTAELIQAVGLLREEAEQRMQAQEAVKAERQRFSNVLETLPAYVCLLTPDYYMPFANRVFREWFGYHPDKKCYEFLFNRTEPCETCETFTVLKTNQSHRWEWTGPNGRNYDIFDFPFKDTDGSQLILEMGMDITELKRAEKAVRGSEERYRSLTVATTQVVWTTDADGQVAGDLPSWRAFTGQDERQIQGWGWIESLHPNDRERTAEIWSQAVRDRALYQTEYRLRRHDGQYRHVSVRGVPVIEPDGRIREWIGACTDITEKKTAEEELDNYRMRLEDLVKQRTQELARSNRDLEQFAYVASHDLQEPLRAIAGFVELLKRNLQSSLDTKTTEYMNFTVDGAVRMQSLISGLLEYSRVGTHGQKPEQTDPRAALERAVANLRMSIKESGAEIATDDLPMVYFDGMQLSQLLQNLISNAIKFRAEQAPRIRISAARLDDSWRFAVADNGIGIDPQYAERIFLIFQRLHSREEYPGTGIGLSICKKIVERHNGKIWVESKPGDGSTFYFTVPDKGETN